MDASRIPDAHRHLKIVQRTVDLNPPAQTVTSPGIALLVLLAAVGW
jgi:hypothetical protein